MLFAQTVPTFPDSCTLAGNVLNVWLFVLLPKRSLYLRTDSFKGLGLGWRRLFWKAVARWWPRQALGRAMTRVVSPEAEAEWGAGGGGGYDLLSLEKQYLSFRFD